MKNLLVIISLFTTMSVSAQTLTYNVTANPGGTITVDWTASFDKPPRYLTIAVFYGRSLSPDIISQGIYGWDAVNTDVPIELSGSRTITPPDRVKGPWFFVIGNACQYTGPEADQYECVGPITSELFKLKK